MNGFNRFTARCVAGLMGLAMGAGTEALAQGSEAVADGTAAHVLTWQEILKSGGWPMLILGFISILLVAFVIYFFVVLRLPQVAPGALHRVLLESIRSDSLDGARKACEYRPCPLASVGLAAMDYVRDVAEVNPTLLRDVIEGEGARQGESFMGQTQYLLDIAVIAPMVGLLGTVFGMLEAFSAVAYDVAKAKPVYLASGVSQALVTTAFGLIVGIPAMAFYAYFRRQASRMVSHLESASTEIMTALLGRRS